MRTITPEYLDALNKNEVYRYIVNAPKPDRSKLEEESHAFAQWLLLEHKKERRMLKEMSNHA